MLSSPTPTVAEQSDENISRKTLWINQNDKTLPQKVNCVRFESDNWHKQASKEQICVFKNHQNQKERQTQLVHLQQNMIDDIIKKKKKKRQQSNWSEIIVIINYKHFWNDFVWLAAIY